MNALLKTKTGRLRIVGMLEGVSLLILIFIAVPMKYYFGNPIGSEIVGPIHGVLFLLFIFYTFSVAMEQKWKFWSTTWKVLLACVIPFGTFYVDRKILSKIEGGEKGNWGNWGN
jgi:integral membrane protein